MSKQATDSNALLSSFPYGLYRDEDKEKVARAAVEELSKVVEETKNAAIFPRIDNLDESLLDILAYDLKIEWYDSSFDIDTKRRLIKECFQIHRRKGTRYAVETALRSIYPDSEVKEWNEYDGRPYHFKLLIHDNANDKEKCKSVIKKINYYKNARSILDETVYTVGVKSNAVMHCGAITTGKRISIYCKAEKFSIWHYSNAEVTAHMGAKVSQQYIQKHCITTNSEEVK